MITRAPQNEARRRPQSRCDDGRLRAGEASTSGIQPRLSRPQHDHERDDAGPTRSRPSATPPRTSSQAAASSSRSSVPGAPAPLARRDLHGRQGRRTRLVFEEYDVAHQGAISHHTAALGWSASTACPVRSAMSRRLSWTSWRELAGLRLNDRWATWTRDPLASDSAKHVSVWEKPPAGLDDTEIAVTDLV